MKSFYEWYRKHITGAIFGGLILGILTGLFLAGRFKVVLTATSVLGSIYMSALNMMIFPLVFCSIVMGIASIGSARTTGKITGAAMLFFLCTTALGRDFGYEPGTLVTGKMVSALRQLGFDYVFDTDFAADLTIMEEGTELLHRLGSYLNGDKEVKIPLMTSCCPGWVSFVEQHFPELRDNLSTAKSPQQMFGAIAKSYFAEKLGVDRKDLVVVSIMPCLAKKYEASRPEFSVEGNPDVDYSIYTRELARLIRYANIDFNELPDGEFDRPLGESTGASVIFGTTGGVIEAACRTAYELYTKKNLDKVDFEELRGLEGIRSATIDFNGTPVKIGIAHGLGNARKLIEEVKNGTSPYHAIEVMACPGGCIGGGGQPFHRGRMEVLRRRAAALYREDANKPLRKSHENPYIQQLYSEYLGEPCGPKAHKLLHTHYIDRKEVIGMYIETEKSK